MPCGARRAPWEAPGASLRGARGRILPYQSVRPAHPQDDGGGEGAPAPGTSLQGVLEHEAVTAAFTRVDFGGLRSLPATLGPAFRETARERRRARIHGQLASLSASSVVDGGARASPRRARGEPALDCRGQVRPGHHGPAVVKTFANYTYLPGEYVERADLSRRADPARWQGRRLDGQPRDFVVRATRPPPRFKGEFGDSEHAADPYGADGRGDGSEAELPRDAARPMRRGGRPGLAEMGAGLLDEHLARMRRELRMHFGDLLVGVEKDVHGLVVARVADDGNVAAAAAFMNGWVQTSRGPRELGLRREIASWGVPVAGEGEVWFAMRGPWVRLRPALPEGLATRMRGGRPRDSGGTHPATPKRSPYEDPGVAPAHPSNREPSGGLAELQRSRPLCATFATGTRDHSGDLAATRARHRLWQYDRHRRGIHSPEGERDDLGGSLSGLGHEASRVSFFSTLPSTSRG